VEEMLEALLLFQRRELVLRQADCWGNGDALFPTCSGALELAACGLNVGKRPKSLGCLPGQWLHNAGCL